MKRPGPYGPEGSALHDAVRAAYELSPAEMVQLDRAARLADMLARVDAELAEAASLVVEGSTGQMQSHPLLRTAVELERTLDIVLRSLALPLPGEQDGKRRSPQAAAAARARWGRNAVGI
jgi:hypothetical protein